jgi:hypothetical protein
MFESRVLRRIFGPNTDEIGGWRQVQKEKLNILDSLPDIRTIKSRRIRWARHVTRMGEMRMYKKF